MKLLHWLISYNPINAAEQVKNGDLLRKWFLEKIARDCCESNLLTLPPPVPSHGGHHRPWWRHHFTQWWSWFDPTRLRPATPARLKTSTRYPGTQGRRVDPRLALSPISHPSMCHTYIIAHSELASPCTHALSRLHVCSRHTCSRHALVRVLYPSQVAHSSTDGHGGPHRRVSAARGTRWLPWQPGKHPLSPTFIHSEHGDNRPSHDPPC